MCIMNLNIESLEIMAQSSNFLLHDKKPQRKEKMVDPERHTKQRQDPKEVATREEREETTQAKLHYTVRITDYNRKKWIYTRINV